MIENAGQVIFESGAILDYLSRRCAGGRLAPPAASPEYDVYQQWMHYAEGSAMLPLMLDMYVRRLGEAGAPLHPRIESEIANHLGFVDGALAGRDYLLGEFSLADIQMSFVGEAGGMLGRLGGHERLAAWVRRCQDRPAYRIALEKGGPYNMGPKD